MRYLSFTFATVLILLSFSCRQSGPTVPSDATGSVSIKLGKAPAGIMSVVATLSRQNFETKTLTLTIQDTTQSASGSVKDLAIGVWHLQIEAFDDSNFARYRGSTDVQIFGGRTSQVNLTLYPTTGNLDISVNWGPADSTNVGGGLLMRLPFDGTTADVSGNGNSGTSTNAQYTTDHLGHANGAYLFNGVDNYITVQSSSTMHPVNQVTITCWAKVSEIQNNYMPLFVKGGTVTGYYENREYAVLIKNNSPWWYTQWKSAGDGGGQHELQNNSTPGDKNFPVNEWEFFAFVADRVNHQMLIYTNGVQSHQIDDSYSTFNANNYPLLIGNSSEGLPETSPFKGAIDDFRIYNRALSAAEIQALYTATN